MVSVALASRRRFFKMAKKFKFAGKMLAPHQTHA
jgi:hypothetical protein